MPTQSELRELARGPQPWKPYSILGVSPFFSYNDIQRHEREVKDVWILTVQNLLAEAAHHPRGRHEKC